MVGYDLMDVTRAALLDGSMTLVISHPLERLAREAIDGPAFKPVRQLTAAVTGRALYPSISSPEKTYKPAKEFPRCLAR